MVLAALAGVCAAAAIVDLAGAARRAERRPRPRATRWERVVGGVALAGRRVGVPTAPRDLQARIDAAGGPLGLGPQDVMAAQCAAALAGGLAAIALEGLAPGRLGLLVLAAGPVAGFLLPELALRRRARQRAAAIALELADVAELLRVAVAAGLPTSRALHEVGRRHPGVLAAELGAAADRMALGLPRAAALARLRRRAPVAGVAALTAAIERADRHGAPLGPALTALAEDARAERARRIRERAARAAPQIQLVVALLLVPAVLLLVAAGLLAGLT
jgi:tight adherence protein C